MSKLDDIIDSPTRLNTGQSKQAIKALIQELVDETFDKDDKRAYEFWKKVEAL